mgnify:CR=1 FL=1
MTDSHASTTPGPAFSSLSLPPAVLENLQRLGYERMTPIQAAALPLALAGKDLIAQAKTGSGKTAAFALPLLANLNPRRFAVQALVLCPTRELAEQVTQELRRLARAEDNIKILTLCGGATMRPQIASLAHGAHIVVGTPGRILDHLSRETLPLDALNTLVLDEADRMLDMGFAEDIATVVQHCPKNRQTLLFSATYPDGVVKLATRFMRDPQQVKLTERHATTKIRQRFYEVREDERLHRQRLIAHLGIARLAIAARAHQGVAEELVRIGGGGVLILARIARLFGEQRARMGEKGRVEMILEGGRAVVFQFTAHIGLHERETPTLDASA